MLFALTVYSGEEIIHGQVIIQVLYTKLQMSAQTDLKGLLFVVVLAEVLAFHHN
jgi:hypothetical protein